jgi:hypothetical protein
MHRCRSVSTTWQIRDAGPGCLGLCDKRGFGKEFTCPFAALVPPTLKCISAIAFSMMPTVCGLPVVGSTQRSAAIVATSLLRLSSSCCRSLSPS